ncbi:MAG: RluA family pseudouridine synthase [Elusimicrobiaceae bacterium]|nr:RluA family pseudouridine synthase [Elusimicrobiaceae bacterium]
MKKEVFQFNGEFPERLDAFVTQQLEKYSRAFVQDLIKNGGVKVDGKLKKPSHLLEKKCAVEIAWPELEKPAMKLSDMIIFEEERFLAVDKPGGLLVHPTRDDWGTDDRILYSGEDTLAGLILKDRPELKKLDRAGIVHRLDRDTSGVMLIAKTPAAQKSLLKQFHDRKVHKTYNCIAVGEIPDERGIIDVPIGRITGGKIKASPMGRSAVTEYHCLQRRHGYTFAELFPKTGRTNQIRVHLAWLGYPVLGDTVYGKKPVPRLMLHSRRIEFACPGTRKKVSFESPLPKDFEAIWRKVTGAAIGT